MCRGKDKQIRLWDAIGGMCVQTLADCLGEITSVEFDREGKYLLAGCKDNSNRLFDLRMVCPSLHLFVSSSACLTYTAIIPVPACSSPLTVSCRRSRQPCTGQRLMSSNAIYIDTQATKIHPRT